MPDKEKDIDLKKECLQLLKEISAILPKFDFIHKIHNSDVVELEDIRYNLSMVKFKLLEYIKHKKQKGW